MSKLDELTIGEARQLATLFAGHPCSESALKVGSAYFIRTLSFHYTGQLERITDNELVLSSAAWIADSGRFADALKTGELHEVEPYPGELVINRDMVVDISPWNHSLPAAQK